MGQLAIERCTRDDLAAVLSLQKLCYRENAECYGDWAIAPLTQTVEHLAAEFDTGIVLKAVAGGTLAGSVRARMVGDVCEIGRLIVHPDMRDRGIGTLLLRAIERENEGARWFELFTGHRDSKNLHVYAREGYRESRRETRGTVEFVYLRKPVTT